MTPDVTLREVVEGDLPVFFEHQLDPVASHMAAFTAGNPPDRDVFTARWARILADPTIIKRTILVDGRVGGHVVSFERAGQPEVSYWIGREHWGKGVATRALREFLGHVSARPLHARAAKDNVASIRVLEKCGFIACGEERAFAGARDGEIDEVVLRLGDGGEAVETRFLNVYDDDTRADAYARLEFPGTYYLAFRDLPSILSGHVRGRKAVDFGCGTGRSTRFLRALGFEVIGVDISEPMLARARARDPEGDYRLVPDGDLDALPADAVDLVLAAFTFDNIPMERKVPLFRSLRRLLNGDGRIVNLVSAPEIYLHEWASFSTRDFPGNRDARSGDRVRIVMLDVDDRRPVEDVLCSDEDYLRLYEAAGLRMVETYRPLAGEAEPYSWVSETTVAPWVITVLADAGA